MFEDQNGPKINKKNYYKVHEQIAYNLRGEESNIWFQSFLSHRSQVKIIEKIGAIKKILFVNLLFNIEKIKQQPSMF